MKSGFVGWHLDFAGFLTSFICAIHCIALPAIVAVGALSGLAWMADPTVEFLFFCGSIGIASFTLFHSTRKQTIDSPGISLFVAGFVMLVISRLLPHSHGWDLALVIAGGLTVAGAHVYHWRIALKRRLRKVPVVSHKSDPFATDQTTGASPFVKRA